MTDQLNQIIDSLREEMIDTLKKWIMIPSVKADPLPNAPFGADVRKMLDVALEDCKRLGFKTEEFDGYIAHADLGEGSDEDALGILAHLDVVPEGDGWKYPPYGAVIEGNRMYGRGTSDDKGPAIAALYAMKAVQMAGIPLKRKVRLILGCDEESGWEDIVHYRKVATMPKIGFSPDASYPVINIEKGLCHLSLKAPAAKEGLKIYEFNTGLRPNVVPGKATAVIEGNKETVAAVEQIAKELSVDVTAACKDGKVELTAIGINGHAAFPEIARNAIGEMLLVLRALGAKGAVKTFADKVGLEYDGNSLGVKICDGMSGSLTCNMGIIRVNEEDVFATLDIRYPIMTNTDMLIKNIRDALSGIDVTVDGLKAPHYVPESSELVQALLDAYHEETGLERKCIAIGGGTYARSLSEGVAFGAAFPDDEDLAHQANEYADLEGLYKNIKIFASAIVKLAKKA